MFAGRAVTQDHSRQEWIYFLGVLAAVSFLNYYDRTLVTILLQPIKQSLNLSDTAAGLLVGPAFALVYCSLGIPIARFADRGYRVAVLTAALSLWSVMTSLCGLASGLTSLLSARFGVGVGEAGGLPTTHALVAEYVPEGKRAAALSLIAVVAALGTLSGTSLGGVLNDLVGWRATFVFAGVPGLLLAGLAFLTLPEPARSTLSTAGPPFNLSEAMRALVRRRSFVYVCGGVAFGAFGNYASEAWFPTYLIRHFNLTPGELGIRYALLTGMPGLFGTLLGGWLMNRWIQRDARAAIWLLAGTFFLQIPVGLMTYLTESLHTIYAVLFIASFFGGIYVGPNYALIQGLAGAKMRATAAAIYMLIVNLIGLGAAPLATGYLSDHLSESLHIDGLRVALCIMLIPYVPSVAIFLKAVGRVAADLKDATTD
jgi:predicted MFS family arabinose efflux permease